MSPTKMPIRLWIAALALSIISTATQASAGESRWYLEGRIGQANLDAELGAPFTGIRIDDEVTSAGIEIGYMINRYFSVQAGYRQLGNAPALPPPCIFCELDERLIIPFEAEVSGLSLAAVPRWPVSERFSLYGKLGIFHSDTDVEVAFSGDTVGSLSDEELLTAIGAHYELPSGFGVLLEYEVVPDLFDGANLGFSWNF